MVLTDRIMAGVYENFFTAVPSIATKEGIAGFYVGWFPALVQVGFYRSAGCSN
jgi:hypothetical protein